jgi:putative oxidoreductase
MDLVERTPGLMVIGTRIMALLYMSAATRGRRIALEVLLWVLAAMLFMVFVRAGWDKFDPSSGWARAFRAWGYPVWFRILIGVLELLAALLLVWPRTAAYAAAIIIVVMLGGMGTHAFVEHRPSGATSELLHLIVASLVLAGRWRTRLNPWPR